MISCLGPFDSSSLKSIPPSLVDGQWPTALAPMQDVTSLPFMKVIAKRGAPDFFFTEFLGFMQIHELTQEILSAVTENPTDRPVFAQLIGENISDLRRTVLKDLMGTYPVAGIDLFFES